MLSDKCNWENGSVYVICEMIYEIWICILGKTSLD